MTIIGSGGPGGGSASFDSGPDSGPSASQKGRPQAQTGNAGAAAGAASSHESAPGAKADAESAAHSTTDSQKSDNNLASAAMQAGGGDVMVMPTPRRKAADDDTPVADEAPDDAPDADAGDGDGGDATLGFFGRVMQRGAARNTSSGDAGDAGGDVDMGDGGKASGGKEAGASSGSKSRKRTKGKQRGERSGGKQGASKGGGANRVQAAEDRDKTEDVEAVSVLVGQDGGGDPVEQALNAKKRILGDDEHKNAFTSDYHDNFDPHLEPQQVERLGSIQGAVHMVRLTDHWEREGFDRSKIIEKTAEKLLGFTRPDQIKRTLSEMNIAPIKDVYPLEVMLRILDEKPDFWPKLHKGELLTNREALIGNPQIQAGHEFRISYPEEFKIKSFALLGGGEPGYEFAPYKNGVYRMVVDEPGTWTFALTGEKKGEAIVDTFVVEVHQPGKLSKDDGASSGDGPAEPYSGDQPT